MKAVSVLDKYCYDLDGNERQLMYFHELNRARQFSDFAGRKLLAGEIARVRNKVLEGLN